MNPSRDIWNPGPGPGLYMTGVIRLSASLPTCFIFHDMKFDVNGVTLEVVNDANNMVHKAHHMVQLLAYFST